MKLSKSYSLENLKFASISILKSNSNLFIPGLPRSPPQGGGSPVGLCQDEWRHPARALLPQRPQRGRRVPPGALLSQRGAARLRHFRRRDH